MAMLLHTIDAPVHAPDFTAPELPLRYDAAALALEDRDFAIAELRRQLAALVRDPPRRILVIDDNQDFATFLAKYLRDTTTIETSVCAQPVQAMHRLCDEPWGVVVADLQLEGSLVHGPGLLRSIPRETAVYLVSGVVPEDLPVVARRVGALGWCAKPPTREALRQMAQKILAYLDPVAAANLVID